MQNKKFYRCLIVGIIILCSSCGINSNIMFKVAKSDEIHYDSVPMEPTEEYLISVNDKIAFQLYTNEGEILLSYNADLGETQKINSNSANGTQYLVRSDGTAELPKIGKIEVEGLSVFQCADTLEKLYSVEYSNPYVQVQVTNKRVVVFPGNGSDAKVIYLQNNNTTLMQALALAGGITDRGKAKKVKLMRKNGDHRDVFVMDLSTIEGLKYADLIVQANDYIYVEPNPQLAREVVKVATPIITVISSSIVILTIVNSLK